jgi:hypothetical protein
MSEPQGSTNLTPINLSALGVAELLELYQRSAFHGAARRVSPNLQKTIEPGEESRTGRCLINGFNRPIFDEQL